MNKYKGIIYLDMSLILVTLVALIFSGNAFARTHQLPAAGNDIIGEIRVVKSRGGDSLERIAKRYHIGYYEMLEANPRLRDKRYLPRGSKVVVPSQFILPKGPRKGIVINLAELRLYYFPKGSNTVFTAPVGIGRPHEWKTPLGNMKIIQKKHKPEWRVPKSVQAYLNKKGVFLPQVMPPGPDNPLGDHMLRLSNPSYLIHGTNQPDGIGRRVSSGCIRMYPDDVERLFKTVPVGTPVRIIHEPVKLGWQHGNLYLESHEPLREPEYKKYRDIESFRTHIQAAANVRQFVADIREARVKAKRMNGVPVQVPGSYQ